MALRQNLRLSATFGARARGLLATDRSHLGGSALLLVPCRSVHTIGMRYPIDIAFISQEGIVLRVNRSVPPGRFRLSDRRAWAVVERAAESGPWLAVGATMSINLATTEPIAP